MQRGYAKKFLALKAMIALKANKVVRRLILIFLFFAIFILLGVWVFKSLVAQRLLEHEIEYVLFEVMTDLSNSSNAGFEAGGGNWKMEANYSGLSSGWSNELVRQLKDRSWETIVRKSNKNGSISILASKRTMELRAIQEGDAASVSVKRK